MVIIEISSQLGSILIDTIKDFKTFEEAEIWAKKNECLYSIYTNWTYIKKGAD